ncbi:MAG: P1 family peptidase, partial [Candidatus Promineifilaceae bacterium]
MAGKRPRDYGIAPGIYTTGKLNAISDVPGVRVGQVTLLEGSDVRTGITAVLPHAGNVYQDRVPAGLAVENGFGKLTGVSQLQELGELETPVILTNTLSVHEAAGALISWTLEQKGNEAVRSVNPVAGETNDGYLNDISRRAVTAAHVRQALQKARKGPVEEGAVGAGTGTVCFGWKGGIGT